MNSKRNTSAIVGLLVGHLFCVSGCASSGDFDEEGGLEAQSLGQAKEEVVYGTDDRKDFYEHPNATLKARAQYSTPALFHDSLVLTSNPNKV